MAMATIELTCAICGKGYTVSKRFASRAQADSFVEYMQRSPESDRCPECYAAEQKVKREEANAAKSAEAAEQAQKAGLPELVGSEKQVAWAETLRREIYYRIARGAKNCTYNGEPVTDENGKAVSEAVNAYFRRETSAKLYIDHREESAQEWLDRIAKSEHKAEAIAAPTTDDALQAVQEDAAAVTTPETQKHPGSVAIKVTETSVAARYERNEAFRGLVVSLGYTWDGDARAYTKKITKFTGDAESRAAELGNKLLLAGFAIRLPGGELRRRAAEADYQPEQTRWVTIIVSGADKGRLSLCWPKGDNKLYNAAKQIRGSKWVNPCVIVPIEHHAEVADFADIHGFSVSDGAAAAIRAYEDAKAPPVAPVAQPEEEQTDKLGAILSSPAGVLPDLLDD
jgi:hypothetical protein